MFKEVLQITPKLSGGDLAAMETNLNSRFGRVAKKFGKGVLGALKVGGGLAGIGGLALGLVDKLLNPLKETQDAIDKTLKNADDLVTNAKQFGTTAGQLAKLQAFGKSAGLDPSTLNTMLEKYQVAIAEAKADPTKSTAVRNYTGYTDMAEGFTDFMIMLNRMKTDDRTLAQQDVFGEKLILKMADFSQSLEGLVKDPRFAAISSEKLTKRITKLGDFNDAQDTNNALRDLNDFGTKGRIINQGMMDARQGQLDRQLQKENSDIQAYQNLMLITKAMEATTAVIAKMGQEITGAVIRFYNVADVVDSFGKSPMMRGILKFIRAE